MRDLRIEASGPGREAAAVGVGVFIGSLPVYGLHLLLCLAAGSLLRLNRLKLYVAANISNPLLAPLLILSEIQTGALARRGELQSLTLTAVKQIDPWTFGGDLVVGSLIVGSVLGLSLGGATYALTRNPGGDPLFADLVRRASDRFVAASIVAWEFARGKLSGDPLYRAVVMGGVLPPGPGRSLVDVGCGSGLALALLAEAAATQREGRWPSDVPPAPVFDRLIGIELRPRVARLASAALGDAATIVAADARDATPEDADAVLFLDVLHMMPHADQEHLVRSVASRLSPSGVILVREADASAGLGFQAVRIGNRIKALAFGHWGQRFAFRSAHEWQALFERLGFTVTMQRTGQGTPFANVLLILIRKGGSAVGSTGSEGSTGSTGAGSTGF
ncbi:MAG: DUF2062 domain-containing protein [Vicinamibacterales bacterium]